MNVLRDPIKTELVLIVFESIFLIGEVIVLALVVLVRLSLCLFVLHPLHHQFGFLLSCLDPEKDIFCLDGITDNGIKLENGIKFIQDGKS